MWGQPSGRHKIESLEQRYYAARKLAEDFAALSFLLTQKASRDGQDQARLLRRGRLAKAWRAWQVIAISSPLGRTLTAAVICRRPRKGAASGSAIGD